MFDLFRSRAKAVRYLLGALLGLVALSMVVTLIPGFGSPSAQRNDQIVAEVGDDAITTRMVSQVIQSQMRNQNMSSSVAGLMAPQIIRQMIAEYATVLQAQKLGFSVSEAELAQGIRALFPQLFQGGQFVGKEVYGQMLGQMGITIPEFENQARRQLLLMKVQGIVAQGTVVTPAEIEEEFKKRNEKAKLAVVKFGAEDFASQIKPAPAELQTFLTASAGRFMMPEKKDISLLIVDEAKLGADIPVADAALRQTYDSQRDRFRVEERVHARHILLKADANTSAADKAKIKAKAEDLLKQVKGGADFAEIAKKNSEDTGSATRGGELDWTNRSLFVKPFSDAAFSLKPNEISGIVESEFGYHIIQTLAKEEGRLKAFEEVKDELTLEARRGQLQDRMPAVADQAQAALAKDPTQIEQVAQSMNLTHVKIDKFEASDNIPQAGNNRQLQVHLATLGKGGVTPVVQTENKYVIAVVRETYPARPATLAEKEKEVRDAYVSAKSSEMADKKAREFEAKLKTNANDLEKTAKELGAKVTETNEFTRTGQIDGVGPAAYFGEQPFVNRIGQVVNVFRVANKSFFFRIVSRTPPDTAKLASDRDDIVTTVRERKLRERRDLFEEGLVDKFVKDGEVKIYDDVIKRFISSYRS